MRGIEDVLFVRPSVSDLVALLSSPQTLRLPPCRVLKLVPGQRLSLPYALIAAACSEKLSEISDAVPQQLRKNLCSIISVLLRSTCYTRLASEEVAKPMEMGDDGLGE
jgi:hypothetical protein